MNDLWGLAGLFAVTFLAATILPAQSEILLLVMATTERYALLTLLIVASIGNILGSCANYAIGYALADSKKLTRYINEKKRLRAEGWYQKFGRWSLLLSWAPFIGDPLTIAAGLLRDRFLYFVVIVTVAKTGRYMAVLGLHHAIGV